MGLTNTAKFTDQQNMISAMAKALAHPARVAILQEIIKAKSCICGDLVSELPLAQATVSQHLKELKSAGIIKGTIEGTSVCYCINPETWDHTQQLLNTFFNSYESESTCC